MFIFYKLTYGRKALEKDGVATPLIAVPTYFRPLELATGIEPAT